jgi:hypothetical protein
MLTTPGTLADTTLARLPSSAGAADSLGTPSHADSLHAAAHTDSSRVPAPTDSSGRHP